MKDSPLQQSALGEPANQQLSYSNSLTFVHPCQPGSQARGGQCCHLALRLLANHLQHWCGAELQGYAPHAMWVKGILGSLQTPTLSRTLLLMEFSESTDLAVAGNGDGRWGSEPVDENMVSAFNKINVFKSNHL